MRIALIGTRGVPARYGGSETAAEEIYSRLAQRGHETVVYCRRNRVDPKQKSYRGIRTVVLPSINTKALDTLSHSFLSICDLVLHKRADIVQFHGIGNSILFPLVRLSGRKVVAAVDGQDWRRDKWNWLERLYLRMSLNLAVMWSNAVFVDAPTAQAFCTRKFGREFPLISYGAEVIETEGTSTLEQHEVKPDQYILFVGRLIPEKGVHHLIQAYEQVDTDYPLLIVGDNPYHPDYVASLKATTDRRIHFLGPIYGEPFWELVNNCYVYVQPSEVEGTSPMLLSAMGAGKCVVVNGIQENLDVIGDAGVAFAKNTATDLADILQALINDPARVTSLGRAARARVHKYYSWDTVADQHEELYASVAPRVSSRIDQHERLGSVDNVR